MAEQTTVRTWGNSLGIRLNKNILNTAGIRQDDILQIDASDGIIILKKKFRHKTFEERLNEYDGNIDICDYDWGEPAGKELF